MMLTVAYTVFFTSLLGIATVFVIYPASLFIRSALGKGATGRSVPAGEASPGMAITCVVIARNAEQLIEKKIRNCLSLDYPEHLTRFVFYSDASTDRTAEIMRTYASDPRVLVEVDDTHKGKLEALNWAVAHCSGDLVLFTDADAMLESSALRKLARHFLDPAVGGVCGKRVIGENLESMQASQASFIRFSTSIQQMESAISSVTANDGKIYLIRESLFVPIVDSVTDDMYVCLSIISQGYRFLYEPDARALIQVPSRSFRHEVIRRRRIVAPNLRCIFMHRHLLNPLQHGSYAVGLFINKVLRRFLPFMLLLLYISNALLLGHWPMAIFFTLQSAFYLTAVLYLLPGKKRLLPRAIDRIMSTVAYFCVGNYGVGLGVIDFLRDKRISRWDPVKH